MTQGVVTNHSPDVLAAAVATLDARVHRIETAHDAMDRRVLGIERLALQIRTVAYTVLATVVAFGLGAKDLLKFLLSGNIP